MDTKFNDVKNIDRPLQVGVLMGNTQNKHPFEVLRGVFAGANDKNVNITVFPTAMGGIYSYWEAFYENENASGNIDYSMDTYNYQYNSLYDYARLGKLDVLIVAYGTVAMYLSEAERKDFFERFSSIPTIVVQEYDASKKLNFIIADNYGGFKELVDHLIEKHNKKKLVCLAGPYNNTDANERMRGYLEAMRSHGLEITDSMIVHGDYSANVDKLVEKLLMDNPDADGMVCANDEMAITAYNVCRLHGKEIGKEFPIVGFDDVDLSIKVQPPLTTVRQDGYRLGLKAIELAMKGVDNTQNHKYTLESPVRYRASCGCKYENESSVFTIYNVIDSFMEESDDDYIQIISQTIAKKCIKDKYEPEDLKDCAEFFNASFKLLLKIRDALVGEDIGGDIIDQYNILLSKLINSDNYHDLKWDFVTSILRRMIENEIEASSDNKKNKIRYALLEMAHRQISNMILQMSEKKVDTLVSRYLMVPRFLQRLKELSKDWNEFFTLSINRALDEGAKSAYIYLVSKPMLRTEKEIFKCPDKLNLVVSSVNDKLTVYDEGEGPSVDLTNGFTELYPSVAGKKYIAYLLFSEEYQYGLMVCETEANYISDLHGVALQISSGLSYMYLSRSEERTRQELYETLRELKEKNQILNSVSSNDPMTGVYNRRGFTERVLELNRQHDGKSAYIFFFDMDHLKEINDDYGHIEGDYAIWYIAGRVNDLAGDDGCCGRIGGDEFVAMVVCDENEAKERLAHFDETLDYFNSLKEKEYLIECSTGYTKYTCGEDVVMGRIIDNADAAMYENKKKRHELRRKIK